MDVSVAPDTAPVDVSAAQETAPEASTPVVNTSVQFTSLHSSWSQPTLPCAVSPSSVAEPVRASESASRSVTPGTRALTLLFEASVRAALLLASHTTPKPKWGLIKRSLQGVMYSATIRFGLSPSAKDRRWSSRKKPFFFAKDSALDSWHACALTYLQTPLPCR